MANAYISLTRPQYTALLKEGADRALELRVCLARLRARGEGLRRRLAAHQPPDWSDLDLELLLSLPGGWAKVTRVFAEVEARIKIEEDLVQDLWGRWQSTAPQRAVLKELRDRVAALEGQLEVEGRELQGLASDPGLHEARALANVLRDRERVISELTYTLESMALDLSLAPVVSIAAEKARGEVQALTLRREQLVVRLSAKDALSPKVQDTRVVLRALDEQYETELCANQHAPPPEVTLDLVKTELEMSIFKAQAEYLTLFERARALDVIIHLKNI